MACAVGEWRQVEIGGRKVSLLNPGVSAVLKAQEECLGASGQVSPSRLISYIGSRWTNPKVDLGWFRHEGEVVEFMVAWNEFRRPEPFRVELSEPYCPEGKTVKVRISDGKELQVLNPGMRWVLEAQEACTGPNGRLSWVTYAERVLRDCVVGGAKLDIFSHEDEVVEFMRLFRLMRIPPTETSGGEGEAKVG